MVAVVIADPHQDDDDDDDDDDDGSNNSSRSRCSHLMSKSDGPQVSP